MTEESDLTNVGPYLETHVAGFEHLQKVEKFSDGQSNPTYLLTAASGRYVLRRQPTGKLLKSAHAVDREFRVIDALTDSAVPVPMALHLCTNRDVIGCLFYVMSYEEGRVFWNPTLSECAPEERSKIYTEMSRVLADLHNVDLHAVGLEDFGKPGDYFERQVNRWTQQYRLSETTPLPSMDRLIEWLPANLPEDDGQVSLVHGDYRLDNIIFHSTKPTVRAVLDWELSTLGHPYADLAYQCMQLRIGHDEVAPGLGGLDRRALGIPSEADYVADYCRRRALKQIPNWDYYLVFSFFRLAAILQGVLKRAIDGNASSGKALDYGSLAPRLAAKAIELID